MKGIRKLYSFLTQIKEWIFICQKLLILPLQFHISKVGLEKSKSIKSQLRQQSDAYFRTMVPILAILLTKVNYLARAIFCK